MAETPPAPDAIPDLVPARPGEPAMPMGPEADPPPGADDEPRDTPPEVATARLSMPQKVKLASLVRKLLTQQNLIPRAFGFLGPDNPVRKVAIQVAHAELFETISIMVILANCIALAMYDPMDRYEEGERNQAIAASEVYFQSLFTIEAIIKLLAFGVYGEGVRGGKAGYFADGWNWLDFFIVVTGYLVFIPELSNIRALRTFRVLRPLKSVSAVPSMRVMVSSMLVALPALGNVVLLAAFTLLLFGIVAVQLWTGLLRGGCHYEDPLQPGSYRLAEPRIFCTLPCGRQLGAQCTVSAGDSCPLVPVRISNATYAANATGLWNATEVVSRLPTLCMPTDNPFYDIAHFDDIGHGVLTLFTGMTLEGWTNTMYATQHTWGTKWVVALYWVVLIAFGTFFLLQLSLAVIWESYQSSQAEEEDKADELLAVNNSLLIAHLRRQAVPWQVRFRQALGQSAAPRTSDLGTPPAPVSSTEPRLTPVAQEPTSLASENPMIQGSERSSSPVVEAERPVEEAREQHPLARAKSLSTGLIHPGLLSELVSYMPKPRPKPVYEPIWPALSAITSNPWFTNILTVVIVLNTIQLAMPYDGMTQQYARGLEIANYAFSAVFGVEMIAKLLGDGPRRYFNDTFNQFDAAVVILSFVDIAVTYTLGDAAGGLAALRTFRLARVFKLVRKWKELNRLLATIIKSLVNVSSALAVLGLILFIFTLLKMQLFGGGYDDAVARGVFAEKPRINWDSFWQAFVSVFVVVTGENWNQYMAEANAVFGPVAIIIFVALVLVGNFVFLNLFLAILLGAFDAEMVAEKAEKDEAAARAKDSEREERDRIYAEDEAPPSEGAGSRKQVEVQSPLHANSVADRFGAPPPAGVPGSDKSLESTAIHSSNRDIIGIEEQDSKDAYRQLAYSSLRTLKTVASSASGSARSVLGSSDDLVGLDEDACRGASSTGLTAHSCPVPRLNIHAHQLSSASLSTIIDRDEQTSGAEHVVRDLSPAASSARSAASDVSAASGAEQGSARRAQSRGASEGPRTPRGSPAAPKNHRSSIVNADMQMVVKKGATESLVTRIQNEEGKTVAVKVMASGDIRIITGESIRGSPLNPSVAFKKLGIDVTSGLGGRWRPDQLSLGCLSPAHKLRELCAVIVAHPLFDQIILVLILISSINLALDEPRVSVCSELPSSDPGNCIALGSWLSYSDMVITALFMLEMVLKMIALGLWAPKSAYLQNPWNVLDFVIVGISILSLALDAMASRLKALRSLRALRALRPLRLVSRYPGLKLVVNAVISAIPKVKNVLLVNFMFLVLLAIVGLQNFSGGTSYCNDSSIADKVDCIGEWMLQGKDCNLLPTADRANACLDDVDGTPFPRIWQSVPQNFDNFLHALLTTFEVATGEAWPDISVPAVDAVGPGVGMRVNANPAAWLYFIIIQIACGFFLLELFTGVIISNYYQLKEESQGSGLLTPEQQAYVEQMKMMLSVNATVTMKRPRDETPWIRRVRMAAYRLTVSKRFEWFIMSLILGNTVVLALRHYGEDQTWVDVQEYANAAFAVAFAIEAALKLVAFGPRQYFSVPWNRFDFVLVVASAIGVAIDVGPVATLFRIFRVARVIRLIRVSRGLLMLFRTLMISLPALINVGIILLLIQFIFSIVGMNLFAGVRYGDVLTVDANFDSFWVAMITLFRCSTGENFNGLMHDLEVQPPYCLSEGQDGLPGNCGSIAAGPIFFSLYFTLSGFILIKLLVAVVLDGFSDMLDEAEDTGRFKLTADWLDKYTDAWSACDPAASKFLLVPELVKLVTLLDHPMGVAGAPDGDPAKSSLRKAAIRLLEGLNLPPSTDGKYQFHAVLNELVRNASSGPAAQLHVEGDIQEGQFSLRETLAAMRLQTVFRARKAKNVVKLFKEARAKQLAEEGKPSQLSSAWSLVGSRRRAPGLFSKLVGKSGKGKAMQPPLSVHEQLATAHASAHQNQHQHHRFGRHTFERKEIDKVLYGDK